MFNYKEWKEAWVLTLAYLFLGPYCIFRIITYPFRLIWKLRQIK